MNGRAIREAPIFDRFQPLRAADLEERVQELGRGLGAAAPPCIGPTPVPLEPARLVEMLVPYNSRN